MKVANAPCSWGILEFTLPGQTISYSQLLDEIKSTQYHGTELGNWGYLPTSSVVLKKALTARSLDMVGAFLPVDFLQEQSIQENTKKGIMIATLFKDIGCHNAHIVLSDNNGIHPQRTKNAGRISTSEQLPSSQWSLFAQGCEHIARNILEKTGIRTVYHHHCAGWIETPFELEKLMSMTSPELLGLCLDTGHYCFAGGSPESIIESYGKRIWHVHFKDCDAAIAHQSRVRRWDYFTSLQHGIFCPLGKGCVNFHEVIKKLKNINYHGWIVVEQDILPGMGTPKRYAQENRMYLNKFGV